MAEFGALIRSAREGRGETGQHLAQRLGIAQSTLVRMEKGQMANLPEPGLFMSVARALGLSPEAMLSAAGYLPSESERLEDSPAVEALRPVLNRYDFDEQDIEHIRYTIEGLGRWMNKRSWKE